jgi:hypothetical protein
MKASELNKRARSLADLPNSEFITYDDEKNSLNEAWRNIYAHITDNDDDYFIETKEYAMQDGVTDDAYTFEFELPTNMYKLRTVDYKDGDVWTTMDKFSLSERNRAGAPKYRFKADKLWIQSSRSWPTIKITYYPPPETIQLPDVKVAFNQDLSEVYSIWDEWAVKDSSTVIQGSETSITLYNENSTTPEVIYSGGTDISFPLYYKNNILFVDGNSLMKLKPDGSAIELVDDIDVSTYRPSIVRDVYYYVNIGQTETKSYNLKTGVVKTFDASLLYDCPYISVTGQRYYLSTNVYGITSLQKNGDVIVTAGVEMFSYPFFSVDQIIYRLDEDDNFTEWGEGSLGYNSTNHIITGTPENGSVNTIGNSDDTDIEYPLNIVPTIIAYSAAIDYTRKAQGDPTLIKTRLSELWMEMAETMRRDDYKPERVNNEYSNNLRGY